MDSLQNLQTILKNLPKRSLSVWVARPSKHHPAALGWLGSEEVSVDFLSLLPEAEEEMVLVAHRREVGEARAYLFCAEAWLPEQRWTPLKRGLAYWKARYPELLCCPLIFLESCAFIWGREAQNIASPAWQTSELPEWWKSVRQGWSEADWRKKNWTPSSAMLHALRLFKGAEAQAYLRVAAEKTAQAFSDLRSRWPNFKSELDVAACFLQSCHAQGALPAYPPIAAAGSHGWSLHHRGFPGPWKGAQGVVVDAGAAWQGYACDVTRTFHGGEPSPLFVQVHDLLLEVQEEAVRKVRPGITWGELEAATRHHLGVGLEQARLLEQLPLWQRGETSKAALIAQLFPHRLGHWIGKEVHDVGPRGEQVVLEAGQALTIEPGLYFPDKASDFGPLSGICVRIEDTLLVTSEGSENLTASIPKEWKI